MLSFRATVSSRSSRTQGGPPSEAEIFALNNGRRELILRATGWADVVPGSLNLEVAEESVYRLLLCAPLIRESGERVKYPAEYSHIPKKRVGYLYFAAHLIKNGMTVPVLIRRAMNPLPTRIEAFSYENLRQALELVDGDVIVCELEEDAV